MKISLPRSPGVYLFKDQKNRVIYVGKAIDLHHRVLSHLRGVMASHIGKIETIVVESELEALILEANLIKKYLPQFNVRLTDDKDYLYIKITKEIFPKVVTARKHDLENSLKYFGPFPSSKTVRETLKALRKVFPWCNGGKRACFYYHLSLCPGACVGEISREDYKKIIKRFIKFLDGKKKELVNELTLEMNNLARSELFEQAQKIKKTLDGINYLTQKQRTHLYLENPNLLEDEKNLGMAELKKVLKLKKIPQRIEGYDISNIQGKEATGSMVVLISGEIDKREYRKFKIKISGKPNDVGMMREMMQRRFKNDWPLPDLIIVDGGRAQARSVVSKISIFGLAKRLELLYPPEGKIIKLPKSSPALKLLQKLRDEAHRFALSYYRQLHTKSMIGL